MKHPFRILRHSFTMVGRTLRSYALLSVTIVLSFTLLLGYLGYVDTSLYNEYKRTFMKNRGYAYTTATTYTAGEVEKLNLLLSKVSEMEDTTYYFMRHQRFYDFITSDNIVTEDGIQLSAIRADVWALTRRAFFLFDNDETVTMFDGSDGSEVYLKGNEAILDLATFNALGITQDDPYYTFQIVGRRIEVKIVGTVDLGDALLVYDGERLKYNSDYRSELYISTELLTDSELEYYFPTIRAIFYTAQPEQLAALFEELGITVYSARHAYINQDEALEVIRRQKSTKGLIACALVLLLGVNLYSSFTNALNERKFEIGVKRAIGASSFSIVRQFLYESMLVMVVNILISIALVIDIGLVWKLIMEATYADNVDYMEYWDFILYLSPWSIAMFAVAAITLTIVFSFIFAYKSTQVEIVQYLKAE